MRIQTTYTFNTKKASQMFASWLKLWKDDDNYGSPRLVDVRDVGYGWCVEFVSNNGLARGVAIGIEMATEA